MLLLVRRPPDLASTAPGTLGALFPEFGAGVGQGDEQSAFVTLGAGAGEKSGRFEPFEH